MWASFKKLFFLSGWISCFAIIALLALLGPTTIGYFLGFFGAQYLSVVLVNLGFVLLALEGFTHAGARWKRIAPALWFGGYFAISLTSHLLAWHFYVQIDRQNAAQAVAWNPASDTLALAHSWSDENRAMVFSADDLVTSYGLDRAYSGNFDEFKANLTWNSIVALHQGICPGGSMNDGPDGIKLSRYTNKSVEFANNLCITHKLGSPEGSTIKIASTGIHKTDLVLDQDVEKIEVVTGTGKQYHLQAGWARALSWLPAPIIGCEWSIAGSSPRWCGIQFGREGARSQGRSPERVITGALGLKKTSLESRFPDLRWNSL